MTLKIGEQAKIRVDELPKGTVQKVVIDARGQKLTAETEIKTINDIVKKSNGIINAENIFFQGQEVQQQIWHIVLILEKYNMEKRKIY